MIFSLVSSAQEWLNVKWDEYKKHEENQQQEKLKELEEAERVKIFIIFFLYCDWLSYYERCIPENRHMQRMNRIYVLVVHAQSSELKFLKGQLLTRNTHKVHVRVDADILIEITDA